MTTKFLNPSPSVSAAGTSAKRMWHGIYNASVVNVNDPLGKNRITLRIPQVLGSSVSNWAEPVGFISQIPAPQSVVKAMFLGGDINHPLWINSADVMVTGSPSGPSLTITSTAAAATDNSTVAQADWEPAGGTEALIHYEYPTLTGPAYDPSFDNMILTCSDPLTVNKDCAITSGLIYFTRMKATANFTISSIELLQGNTAGTGTPNFYGAIYDVAGNLTAQTANCGSLFTTSFGGHQSMPLITPYNVFAGQTFFTALLSFFTGVQPSFYGYIGPTGLYQLSNTGRFATSLHNTYTAFPANLAAASDGFTFTLASGPSSNCLWTGVF